MNATTEIDFDHNRFDLEDSEDVIGLAKGLINGRHPGILSTVNEEGRPQLRWMSTLSFVGFPLFHTLTSPNSRKVDEIRANPRVNWMFFNEDMSLVLNLHGTARVIEDTIQLKEIWQQVVDASHAYFLNQYGRKLGFVAIETKVDSIECTSPQTCFRFTVAPEDLAVTH